MSTKTRKPSTKAAQVRLRESCACEGTPDTEGAPVVRDVKIIGLTSRNGRVYPPEVLRKAVSLYEGRWVYLNHPTKQARESKELRRVEDKFARFRNVRFVDGDGLRADLHYNSAHPITETFLGWVDTDPEAIGFSPDHLVKRHFEADGTMVIDEIVEVNSVDLVADPATTEGLFESHTPCNEDHIVEDDIMTGGGGEGTESTLAEKIGELAKHICTDESMDGAAKLKKLKAALKMLEEDAVEEEEVEEEDDKEYEEAEEALKKSKNKHGLRILEALKKTRTENESFRLRESHQKLEAKSRKMCAEANLPAKAITDLFVEQLTEATDDKKRQELIADRKSVFSITKAPVSQSGTNAKKKLTVDDLLGVGK